MPVASAAMLLTLPACFTGIESTPGITKAELKRQRAEKPSAEQQLMASVRHEPYSAWTPGKRFVVTDRKAEIAFTPESVGLQPGAELTFSRMNPVLTIMADSVADLVFTTASGTEVTYRTELPPSAIRQSQRVIVPFTVEQSMIHTADSLLRGRKLYILTPHRLSADGSLPVDAAKYVPVTVTGVKAGDSASPLRIIFTDDNSGAENSILVNADSNVGTTREFHRMFALTDPRRNWPKISDSVWQLITMSRVAPDMTREECRLALGSPDEVEHYVGVSNTAERWTYANGTTLIFEEGILTTIR